MGRMSKWHVLLFVSAFILLVTGDADVDKDEVGRKSQSDDELEEDEEMTVGNLENSLERLREYKILHDTILKLVPMSNMILNEKINKKQQEDVENDVKGMKESLEDVEARNIWLKANLPEIKAIELIEGGDDLMEDEEDLESWADEIPEDDFEPEPLEPLTPEQKKAEEFFRMAQSLLNATRANKAEGYAHMAMAASLGHREARSTLAWARLFGANIDSTSANSYKEVIANVTETFRELAETGLPSAHMGMGFLYATGLGGLNVSQGKALLHYTMAALGGETRAQMIMGYRHSAGVATPVSCERALDFYRKVADKVAEKVSLSGGPNVQRVRLLEEHENSGSWSGILDQDLIEYYQLLADKGDVQAQVALGQLHYQGGRGVPLDYQKALHYFKHAADSGNPLAMAFLGKIYLEGSDIVKQDNETAYKYFKQSADQGNPIGQSGLGLMYLHGKGIERDTAKAQQYFSQAADQGWVDGQLQLGNMYLHGIGVRRDFKLANKYFNQASQSGHVLAVYNLAQMHASGTGMMRSCLAAVELLKTVAERGKWSEQLMIAHKDYRKGRIDEAFVSYAFLGEMGYEVAQSNAAFILDRGETTILTEEEGLVRALALWARAAAQGYSTAQVKLGDAHYYGRGTKVDYEVAASHYRLASVPQHNAQAMFNLGYMHERGLGLAKDRHLAKRCYDLAAEASPDARIPVALALIKLFLLFGIDYLENVDILDRLTKWDQLLGQNWDLYLIGLLTGVLSLVFYFRRPQPPQAPVN